MNDEELQHAAKEEMRAKKKELIEEFAGSAFPSVSTPVTIFMAGSPGAGKTEFSKNFVQAFAAGEFRDAFGGNLDLEFTPIVRIDPDEIRDRLSQYRGGNAHLFQGAVSDGVSRLIDYCQDKNKSYVLDGTFSKIDTARKNIQRSIGRNRPVIIAYLYQDPIVAWEFTQQRERLEGRRITKEVFVDELFAARHVVQEMKNEFGQKVEIWFIQRDFDSEVYKIDLNVRHIDGKIKIPYSKDELLGRL